MQYIFSKTLDKLLNAEYTKDTWYVSRGVTKINKNLYRAALAKAGYTQEQLAKALGIAESTLIRKVKNDAITMDEANKIIGILKIDDPSSVFFTQIVT